MDGQGDHDECQDGTEDQQDAVQADVRTDVPQDAPQDESAAEHKDIELPVPFAAFARTLRPGAKRDLRNPRSPVRFAPGDPDEVYLRLLRNRHGQEKHTPTEWRGLIDAMREEPAHPHNMTGA